MCKLALFAPIASQKLSLSEWLIQFNSLCSDKNSNYKSDKCFEECLCSLEVTLCMMFSAVNFSWFDSVNDRYSYVDCMCKMIRSYLYFVEGIDITPWQEQTTCVSTMLRCYDFYISESKKNK